MLARDGVSPGSRSRDGGTGLVLTWESAEWKSQSNGGNGIGPRVSGSSSCGCSFCSFRSADEMEPSTRAREGGQTRVKAVSVARRLFEIRGPRTCRM